MPISQPYRVGATWGSFSWTEGFRSGPVTGATLWEEARQSRESAEAVINRLMRHDRPELWELAEKIMDRFL